MKYRLKAAVFTAAIGVFALSSGQLVGAVEPREQWISSYSQPVIVDRTMGAAQPGEPCPTFEQEVDIVGKGRHQACVFEGHAKVVTYFDRGSRRIAASLTADGTLYPVRGVCEMGLQCYYGPEKDVLLSREYGAHLTTNAHIRKNFSQGLSWRIDPGTLLGFYQYDSQLPDYIFRDSGDTPVPTESVALSKNGAWAIVELRDKGTAVINTETFAARRVIAPGYTYGRGLDPAQHLAISNDGLTGVVAGYNSGFTIVSLPSGCGELIRIPMERTFHTTTEPCPTSDAQIGEHVSAFYAGLNPSFSDDGASLSVIVISRSAPPQAILFRPSGLGERGTLEYLALGDSFTSGEGETDDLYYRSGTNTGAHLCHLSRRSYPFLLASMHSIDAGKTQSVACSGARIGDIFSSEPFYSGQGGRLERESASLEQAAAITQFLPGRIPQGRFVEIYRPNSITIGVGGNDSGLMDKLKACSMPGVCEWVRPDMRHVSADEVKRLYDPLIGMYASLRRSVSDATLYAVGYPLAVDAGGKCDQLTNLLLAPEERQFMNESVKYINAVIKAAAETSGVIYIDVEQAFHDARLCGTASPSAMNGFRLGREVGLFASIPLLHFIGSETFHPTPLGHMMIAHHATQQIPNLMEGECDCAATATPEPSGYWQSSASSTSRQYYSLASMVPEATRQSEIAVNIPAGNFKPNTNVIVEIHSTPVKVGSFVVSSDGSLTATVAIPSEVPAGYHTIHVLGEDIRGTPIAYYQTLRYELEEDDETNATAAVLAATSIDMETSKSIQDAKQHTNSGEMLRPGQLRESVLGGAQEVSTEELSPKLSHGISLVWICTGIITVCLLLALSLRNSFLRTYLKKLSRQVTFWKRSP